MAFDTFTTGGAQFGLAVDLGASTATAESLVGAGSDDALSDFGAASNSAVDVTRHWAFAVASGTNVLSSVGDLFPDTDVVGNADLFTRGILSGIETNPPDGTNFSIVDPATCTGPPGTPSCGGLGGGFQDSLSRAWAQSELVANLVYDGLLLSVGNVEPVFGTEGRPLVPEPGTALLLGLGLAGLSAARRRLR